MRTTWKPFTSLLVISFLFLFSGCVTIDNTTVSRSPKSSGAIASGYFTSGTGFLSYGEWTKVSEGIRGDTTYVDFDRIEKHGGYIYWWSLTDYVKASPTGTWSNQMYSQGDCKVFRFKTLSFSFYKERMGGGTVHNVVEPQNKCWSSPVPNTKGETILKAVCNH